MEGIMNEQEFLDRLSILDKLSKGEYRKSLAAVMATTPDVETANRLDRLIGVREETCQV